MKWAAPFLPTSTAELAKIRLDSKVNVKIKNRRGYTALMNAAYSGTATNIKALLDAGADINTLCTGGWIMLHFNV